MTAGAGGRPSPPGWMYLIVMSAWVLLPLFNGGIGALALIVTAAMSRRFVVMVIAMLAVIPAFVFAGSDEYLLLNSATQLVLVILGLIVLPRFLTQVVLRSPRTTPPPAYQARDSGAPETRLALPPEFPASLPPEFPTPAAARQLDGPARRELLQRLATDLRSVIGRHQASLRVLVATEKAPLSATDVIATRTAVPRSEASEPSVLSASPDYATAPLALAPPTSHAAPDFRVDLSTASAVQLMVIPGITAKRAYQIITTRESGGLVDLEALITALGLSETEATRFRARARI